MKEEQSLLECMLQEASNIQRVELSHDEIKTLLAKAAEVEGDLTEKFQKMTLKEFFDFTLKDMESKKFPIAEKNQNNFSTQKSKTFGAAPDAIIKIYFDENNVTARICITPPKEGGHKPPVEMLSNILDECGITYGVKHSNVKRLSRTPVYNTYFVLAEGVPAIDGENGKTTFLFDTEGKLAPKVDETTGRVDYKELSFVREAKEGDVLCKITKPTEGKDGINIFGKVIPAKKGEKSRVDAGKDTKVIEEENETLIVACCDGEIFYKNNKISINKVLTVDDVDATKGNLNFIGSIHVKGNVHSGFKVKASGGNIVVDGVVQDAKLSATGDIIINGGIRGSGMSEVKAKGDVKALFIENATVSAKQNIYADYVLNSNLESEQQIKLSGKYGFIIGGVAKAVEIIAEEAGNDSYTLTKLEINYPKEVIKQIAETRKEWKECQVVLEQEEARAKKDDSEQVQIALLRARMTEKRLEGQLLQLEGRLAEIKRKTKMGVCIQKQLYPNVVVLMEHRNYHNKELKQKCTIRKVEGKWKITY